MASNYHKCPYCSKCYCVYPVVLRHAEKYGGSIGNSPCKHCGKIIRTSTSVIVEINSITKTDAKDSDWVINN